MIEELNLKMNEYENRVNMVYQVVSHALNLFADDYKSEEFTDVDSLSDAFKGIVESLVEADEYYKPIVSIGCSSPDLANIVMKFDFDTHGDYYIKVIVPIHTTHTLGNADKIMVGG